MQNEELEVHNSLLVFATLLICKGCCCHKEEKGHFNADLSKLEEEWVQRKLFKSVNLIISGCTGHCNLANSLAIITPTKTLWFGKINSREYYDELIKWAEAMLSTNSLLPIPQKIMERQYNKYK